MIRTKLSSCVILAVAIIYLNGTAWAAGTISGQITGLPKAALELVLHEDINRKVTKVVATVPVDTAGRFKFEGKLLPHIYELRSGSQKLVMLVIGTDENISVTGDVADPGKIQVTGSDDTAKLEAYEVFRRASLEKLVGSVRAQIKKLKSRGTGEDDPAMKELAELEIRNYATHRNELVEYIKEKMGTSLAIYATSIRWYGDDNLPFLIDLAKRFEKAHPQSDIAARINEKVKTLTANSKGGKVAEIKMPDKNGQMVSLLSLKAKYVLIDFWASWCAPCRGESGLLGDLYSRFHAEGFDIYGVGLESEKDTWLRAIDRDKRIWTNVSTFQEFETPATFDYAVTSLPANILIDSSGRIIAKNLHGKDLQAAVEDLFSEQQ